MKNMETYWSLFTIYPLINPEVFHTQEDPRYAIFYFTDIVSSLYHLGRLGDNNVIALLQKLVSGNTGMEKIDGISDDDYHTRGGYDSPYKGHEVDTWIAILED